MVRSVLYTLAIKKDRGEGERQGGTGEERERERRCRTAGTR